MSLGHFTMTSTKVSRTSTLNGRCGPRIRARLIPWSPPNRSGRIGRRGMYYGERFNAISHLLGALLAVSGAVVLVALAALSADVWKVVSFAIYGATLVLVYSVSTAYHSVRGRAKRIFRKLDHQTIYLLIAGTYTPFCLVTLRGPWGWSLFGIVWGLAAFGMLQEVRRSDKTRGHLSCST